MLIVALAIEVLKIHTSVTKQEEHFFYLCAHLNRTNGTFLKICAICVHIWIGTNTQLIERTSRRTAITQTHGWCLLLAAMEAWLSQRYPQQNARQRSHGMGATPALTEWSAFCCQVPTDKLSVWHPEAGRTLARVSMLGVARRHPKTS